MSAKIIRDPLYNYIGIDRKRDGWLLDVLNSPEIQRLRRVHQLGVSYLTYPGADHSRLVHSLGVLHLMTQMMEHLESNYEDAQVRRAREPLLAAALVHDVGHGPFSHLFEPCLGINHEDWSVKIIECLDTTLHKALRACDQALPSTVAELVDPRNRRHPLWQKYLLSSQLDMDRLDYLRRDSLFTGSDYGHFDWYRLINSLELHDDGQSGRDIVWPEKACLAIEEFIFSRYYMYHNVYLSRVEYDPPQVYCLVDRVQAKYYQPYFPEKESDEQSVKNAIWVRVEGEARPIEISNRLTRLKPVTEAPAEKVRYYVPKDLQKDAQALRSHWK